MPTLQHELEARAQRRDRSITLFRILEDRGVWGDKEQELIRLILSELWGEDAVPYVPHPEAAA